MILLCFLYNILFIVHVSPCLSVCIEHVCVFHVLRSSLCKYTYRSWRCFSLHFLFYVFLTVRLRSCIHVAACVNVSVQCHVFLIRFSFSSTSLYMYSVTHTHTHTQSNVFRFCWAVTCSFWSSESLACSSLGCRKSSSSSLYYFMFVLCCEYSLTY